MTKAGNFGMLLKMSMEQPLTHLTLKHPDSYKRFIVNEDAKERAQWTRAFVIPHAVSAAHECTASYILDNLLLAPLIKT